MDVGLLNFGGIRVPMPEGAVTLDDLSSMFPFVNYLAYAKVKGAGITKLLEQLAGQDAFQAVSGVKVVVKNHKLESATIGGKPIDPKKVYNVATIDFLLDGGDQIAVGAVADKVVLSHELVKDIMIKHIKNLEAKGQLIECKSDGRVIMTEE
jgi:2',3'-cyclic-nucleotide 2'-phosphodiesterase (5'-nucleotidase family)